jgi:hypothetical protein
MSKTLFLIQPSFALLSLSSGRRRVVCTTSGAALNRHTITKHNAQDQHDDKNSAAANARNRLAYFCARQYVGNRDLQQSRRHSIASARHCQKLRWRG